MATWVHFQHSEINELLLQMWFPVFLWSLDWWKAGYTQDPCCGEKAIKLISSRDHFLQKKEGRQMPFQASSCLVLSNLFSDLCSTYSPYAASLPYFWHLQVLTCKLLSTPEGRPLFCSGWITWSLRASHATPPHWPQLWPLTPVRWEDF